MSFRLNEFLFLFYICSEWREVNAFFDFKNFITQIDDPNFSELFVVPNKKDALFSLSLHSNSFQLNATKCFQFFFYFAVRPIIRLNYHSCMMSNAHIRFMYYIL